jgi:hypothetical protein
VQREKKIIFFSHLGLAGMALLLAGCPEQLGQQCPSNTIAIGQYALAFAGEHASNECKVTQADGGKTPLVADDGGTRAATLCTANADGGVQLYLSIAGKGQRSAQSFIDGGFRFLAHTDATPGTACVCSVAIDETFDGVLSGAWDGSFPIQPDGGLPLVTGVSGTLVDLLSAPSNTGCACDIPCSVTYAVRGTRY